MLDEVAATEDNPSRDPLVPNRKRNSNGKLGTGVRLAIVRFKLSHPHPTSPRERGDVRYPTTNWPFAAPLNPMTTPPLPEQIELHRDRMWRRDEDLRVESALDAERFIEDVGFANTLTDARRAGPSLYIAVCGRRDVSLPRNVQKDEETRLTWYLKDEV